MGDGAQWQRIYELNRDLIGANPERLQLGVELRIPQD
jgi:nucleoid-associated protein YgaU